MPTYLWECPEGHRFTQWFSIDDSGSAVCVEHEVPCVKVMTPPMISQAATPNRERVGGPPAGNSNSWERGVPHDDRGMPFLGRDGAPIGQKEYSQRRSEIDDWRRRLQNDQSVFQGQE
jgi:hypothetical protein